MLLREVCTNAFCPIRSDFSLLVSLWILKCLQYYYVTPMFDATRLTFKNHSFLNFMLLINVCISTYLLASFYTISSSETLFYALSIKTYTQLDQPSVLVYCVPVCLSFLFKLNPSCFTNTNFLQPRTHTLY